MADGHTLQADVQLHHDAAPQVVAAAGELNEVEEERQSNPNILFFKMCKVRTYYIDESRKKDDDDGEDSHQGAVQSGLDYPFRKSLQGDWEELEPEE